MDRRDNEQSNTSGSSRDRYRDNDDVRNPVPPEDRMATKPDTKGEARGDARENVGNTAHRQHHDPDR